MNGKKNELHCFVILKWTTLLQSETTTLLLYQYEWNNGRYICSVDLESLKIILISINQFLCLLLWTGCERPCMIAWTPVHSSKNEREREQERAPTNERGTERRSIFPRTFQPLDMSMSESSTSLEEPQFRTIFNWKSTKTLIRCLSLTFIFAQWNCWLKLYT